MRMYLPQLNEIQRTREMIEVFKGYNHNPRISEGEFYDMKNLSSRNYPLISPRAKRGLFEATKGNESPIIAMESKDGLLYITNDIAYYKDKQTEPLGLSKSADASKSSIVSMGAYAIVITRDSEGNNLDKIWINTTDMTHGFVEANFDAYTLRCVMCDINGNEYKDTYAPTSPLPPYKPENNSVWVEPAEPYDVLQYDENKGWSKIKTYIKIIETGIGAKYETGDKIEIRKGDYEFEINQPSLFGLKEIVEKKNDNIIIVEGFLVGGADLRITTQTSPIISTSRDMPNMDFIIESNNRLWGCRYGTNKDGEFVNEIYASKLGDFKNWNSFQGISTDSYIVSVGTDGEFTGAISYRGYPTFFKDNAIHRVYGSMPSEYTMQTTEARGVQKGSNKSLAIVNELLYYKSQKAICVYDGSYPTEISQALGTVAYGDAVAGVLGNKYYVSMLNLDRSTDVDFYYDLFVFDSNNAIWHKEDGLGVSEFATYKNNLYYIDRADTSRIKTVLGDTEKDVRWMAETGIIGLDNPDSRYISKINIRALVNVESRINVFIKYNSMGDWIFVGKIMGANLQSHNLPIIPKRCDHFQLKFEGVGDCRIYSISKTIEKGGEF